MRLCLLFLVVFAVTSIPSASASPPAIKRALPSPQMPHIKAPLTPLESGESFSGHTGHPSSALSAALEARAARAEAKRLKAESAHLQSSQPTESDRADSTLEPDTRPHIPSEPKLANQSSEVPQADDSPQASDVRNSEDNAYPSTFLGTSSPTESKSGPSWKKLRAERMHEINRKANMANAARQKAIVDAQKAAASAASLRKSMLSGTYRFCPGGKCR